MKTKMKKDWMGRKKSIDELHYDSKQWLSELEFNVIEIQFLEHLIRENYINCLDAGLKSKVNSFSERIKSYKTSNQTLHELILKQEQILGDLIATESVNSNKNYLENHKKLEKEIFLFLQKYKVLKKEIFAIIEEIMKKKERKKLS